MPARRRQVPGAIEELEATGTVPKRQDTGFSNGALGDSAGGMAGGGVRSCAERKTPEYEP